MKLDYLSRTEQWQEIETTCHGKTDNYLYMNILARALAEQGKLTDNLLKYRFKNEVSLIVLGIGLKKFQYYSVTSTSQSGISLKYNVWLSKEIYVHEVITTYG